MRIKAVIFCWHLYALLSSRPLLANSAGRSSINVNVEFPVGWSPENGISADFGSSLLDIVDINVSTNSEVSDEMIVHNFALVDC